VHWEDDGVLPPVRPVVFSSGAARKVCIIGAIGTEKGYDVLLACARDAASRKLKLQFCLVGYSCDDTRLLATDHISITGRYEEHQAVDLIRSQKAALAWLPSIWPETWSYTLTLAWQAGLNVVAFDIGTPAERIRRARRGWLLPLGLSPARINDSLLKFCAEAPGPPYAQTLEVRAKLR
jgi:glycosyltransferase involved in cell wall biosynthesis